MTAIHEQFDEYGFEIWEENTRPLAYLITFRTFGTWLPGDRRGYVDRKDGNCYGQPKLRANPKLELWMKDEMGVRAVFLSKRMRNVVEDSIRDLCIRNEFVLKAINVRTNHVHVVVSAAVDPKRLADALKSAATKGLRAAGLADANKKIWSRGRSGRYLWKPRHVDAAIEYTTYGQGHFVRPN